ncbi:MFS transporter [Kibdelosporangium lantanae]
MMAPLAFAVLATGVTGSYRLGGVLVAVFTAARIVAAQPAGRLLDRIGVARGLRLSLVLCAVSLCGLMACPPAVMVASVAVAGLVGGGLAGGTRALLSVDSARLDRAVTIDAMMTEVVVVAGPLVVALLSPRWAVVAMAGSYLLAVVLVPRGRAAVPRPGPWPRLGSWLLCAFGFGHLLSTIEVASLPLGQRVGGGPATAVVVVAVLTATSLLGAGLYAWLPVRVVRPWPLLGAMAVGAVLVGVGGTWPTLILGLVTVGVATGPMNTVMSAHLQAVLPEDRRAEGFGLIFTAQATGFALGSVTVAVLPVSVAPLLGALSVVTAAVVVIAKPVTVE